MKLYKGTSQAARSFNKLGQRIVSGRLSTNEAELLAAIATINGMSTMQFISKTLRDVISQTMVP